MDLFSDIQKNDGILGTWSSYFTKDELGELNNIIENLYSKEVKVYPERKDIFNALVHTSLDKVNVVILGQDPYYDGKANGYAFACKEIISPSLNLILGAIKDNFKYNTNDFDLTLKHWVRDGVLLLNTSLTVEENNPNSHKGIYDFIISKVIKLLNTRTNLVWLLWGSESQKYKSKINKGHLVLEAEHPANAARSNRKWICDHFMTTNKYLHSHNKNIINWYE